MAFMIIFGITIRTFNLLPDRFIAIFYTGLGAALFLAGIIFGLNYYKSLNKTLDYSPKFLINMLNTDFKNCPTDNFLLIF